MQLWDWAYDWLFKYRKPGWCLKDKACNDLTIRSAHSSAFSTKLQSLPDPVLSENRTTSSLTEEWSKLTKIITDASTETLGYTTRRHHDWFDENKIAICKLLQAKNMVHCQQVPYSTRQVVPIFVINGNMFAIMFRRSCARWKMFGG